MSDEPQFDSKDSGLDKLKYKNFYKDEAGCDESTDPGTIDANTVWCCVYNPLDSEFQCMQKTLLETLGTDLEVFTTQAECIAKSKCAQKYYCEYDQLLEQFECNEKQIAAQTNPDISGYSTQQECEENCTEVKYYCVYDTTYEILIATGLAGPNSSPWKCVARSAARALSEGIEGPGYDTPEECEANCSAQKWICVYETGLNLDMETVGYICKQYPAGRISAEQPPETISYDTKEECEQNGDCQKKWYCMPVASGGYECSYLSRGDALDPINGYPEAVGYDTQQECEDNCPFPVTEEPPSPTPTPT